MDKRTTDDDFRKPVERLARDLVRAAATLSDREARFLVDAYYSMQEERKRANNQLRAMEAEPHMVIDWLAAQHETLEGQIKRALDAYSDAHPVGPWLKSLHGIGPVIAAGLMAHIDITKAPTAGHIWRFAGLDPTMQWKKGQKRPWNASLRTLCWKIGQSFVKFSGAEECVYGAVTYRKRKEMEVERNERGENAETAQHILSEKNFGKTTEAYKALITGKLPPAQIDARARRYAVKLFLSHLQMVWWFISTKELPPLPYPIAHLAHAHMVPPPNIDQVPGLAEALRSRRE